MNHYTDEWSRAKQEYESEPIPKELDARVHAGIEKGRRRAHAKRAVFRTIATAAACFVVLFAGLNLFPSFASAAADAPVAGALFRVLTVRSYHNVDSDRTVSINQPAISGDDAFTQAINQEIQERVQQRTAEGEQIVQEYKDAFLSTGGTEEEWEQKDCKVTASYVIKSQSATRVSFVVTTICNVADAYQESTYYNLDIAGDRELTLKDLLGDNWVNLCNTSIKRQMADSEDPSVYFDNTMGGFETVDETTDFYINKAGNPVVVFPRATVAIGAMGQVEFEIRN
jgi:hypothetical protein